MKKECKVKYSIKKAEYLKIKGFDVKYQITSTVDSTKNYFLVIDYKKDRNSGLLSTDQFIDVFKWHAGIP